MTNSNKTDRRYLDDLGRIPLLTAAEELHLARLIQAGQDPDATPIQKRRGVRARNRMVQANLRLAVTVAAKLRRRRTSMDLQDLINEAVFGLTRAAEKFDPSLGHKFSTYAYRWINQALTRGVAARDPIIYVPSHVGNTLYRMSRAVQAAGHDGEVISLEEAAKRAEATGGWRQALAVAHIASLNALAGSEDGSELINFIRAPDPDDPLEDFEFDREQVERIVLQLPPPLKHVVQGVYGIGREPITQRQIAKELKIKPSTVSHFLDKAHRRILRQLQPNLSHETSPSGPDDGPTGSPAAHLARATPGQPTGAASAAA